MSLIPENSYLGKCNCGTEFMAPKGTLHCTNCLYSEIKELEKQSKSRSDTIIEYSNRIEELEEKLWRTEQESEKAVTRAAEMIAELEKERDEISLAQFVYAYSMDQHRNPIDLYHWLIKWNHLKALKEQEDE